MTDQAPVTYQQQDQPAPPAQDQPAGSKEVTQDAQPQYVTREEAQRLAQEAAEQAFRRAQGLNDKQAAKINGRIDELLTSYKAVTGQEPTPEIRERARQEAEKQAQQPGDPGPDDLIAQVNRRIDQLYENAGLKVYPGDPEEELLDKSNPDAFVQSIERALTVKKARLAGSPTSPEPAPVAQAPIIGNAGGASNNIRNITDPTELLRMGLSGRK